MSDLFISYSHKDSDYAHRLAEAIRQAGFSVWIDDEINYGSRWTREIEQQLSLCAAFIVIVTPQSYKSDWVQNELSYAYSLRKPMFPLLLEGTVWLSVASLQHTDVRDGILPNERFFARLRETVEQTASQMPLVGGAISSVKAESVTVSASPVPIKLPKLEWCDIPAGDVAILDKTYHIEPFRMARYPVTNQQFQIFVDDTDGYANMTWWNFSTEAQQWREEHTMPLPTSFKGDKRPRTEVSWFEAMAFSSWLSSKLNMNITLPTEPQWQWASQGDDQREWPWGNVFDVHKANIDRTAINQTTTVDRYPDGVSPYGVYDMSGNAYEWMLNELDSIDSINLSGMNRRALRGGSWTFNEILAKVTHRDWFNPDDRDDDVGFRVIAL